MRASRAAAASTSIRSAPTPAVAVPGERAHATPMIALRAGLITFTRRPVRRGRGGDTPLRGRRDRGHGRRAASSTVGPAAEVLPRLPPGTAVTHYANALITAGFVDTHVHYPQLPIIGAGGKPLLDWLSGYTFAAEERFADDDYARSVARAYLRENLRNGITTAAVFCTVHAVSGRRAVRGSARRSTCGMIAGKVLMDRNAPAALLDTAQRGYDESQGADRALARQGPPRLSRSRRASRSRRPPAQLDAAGALKREHPDVHVQSHVSENLAEIALVAVAVSRGVVVPRRVRAPRPHRPAHDLRARRASCRSATSRSCTRPARRSRTARRRTISSAAGSFKLGDGQATRPPVRVGPRHRPGRRHQLLDPAHDAGGVRGRAAVGHAAAARRAALYLATRGAAHALDLDDRIGSVAPGMEADLVVLDLALDAARSRCAWRHAKDIDEALAVQMALADDRAVRATYVAGTPRLRSGRARVRA